MFQQVTSEKFASGARSFCAVPCGVLRLKTVVFVVMLFAVGVVGLAIRLASQQRNSHQRVC